MSDEREHRARDEHHLEGGRGPEQHSDRPDQREMVLEGPERNLDRHRREDQRSERPLVGDALVFHGKCSGGFQAIIGMAGVEA